jgi:hypothetical protein
MRDDKHDADAAADADRLEAIRLHFVRGEVLAA